MNRRILLAATAVVGLAALGATSVSAQDLPPLAQKDRYKVGFSQMESNNPWRIAETKSFHDTAESLRLGHDRHRRRRLRRQAGGRRRFR